MSNSNVKTVILFDSNSSINDIKQFIEKSDTLVISFDFNSHKLLNANKIPHKISDNWIERNEYLNIQKHVYKLSHWFNHPDLNQELFYDEINLGELIFGELLYFLPTYISNFLKIKNIFSQYVDSTFLANGILFDLINKLTSNSNLLTYDQTYNQTYNDPIKIKYNLKIFHKNLSIQIPTKQYLFIKNNVEQFLNYFVNPKKLSSKNNNLLLVNFHTEKYASFFNESINTSVQLYAYNTIMPNFWNHNSYSIIKKSKCYLINEPILSSEVKYTYQKSISKLKEQCEKLWQKEEYFFESLFNYENFPLWNSFKNYFFNLCKTRISNYLIQIEKIKIILDKYKIKNVLVWSETNPVDIIFLQLRKKYGYKVFKLQHGYYPESELSSNFCQAYRMYGLKSDKYFVWGKATKLHYLNYGFPDEKIVITGSPIHDPFFQKANVSLNQNNYVLLGTNTPVGIFADETSISIQQEYENSIKIICKEIIRNNKKLIVKLHPATDQMELTSIIHQIDPSIPIFYRGELPKLLTNCELYVSAGVSTSILDALVANKPVINVLTQRHPLGNYEILDYVLNSTQENFGKSLKQLLDDKFLYNSLIKKGNIFVEKYFSNRGNAASTLLNYVNNLN